MDASAPENPADETPAADDDVARENDVASLDDLASMDNMPGLDDVPSMDDVATIVGEVTESAEETSSNRAVTDVARSALARVRQGGSAVGRRGTSIARHTPGTGLARRSAEAGKWLAGRGSGMVGWAPRSAGRGLRWLAHEVIVLAPRLPVRDQERLRAQFPGKSPDDVADALIEGAARASAAVGATIGVWSVLPIAPAFPAEIVTETLTLVGIEIKLIAELHEVYGMRPPGDRASRMTSYVGAWANRRGVALGPGGVVVAAGPLARRLQRRLAGRAGRSAVSLGPLLTGAAVGAILNRRETRRLGHEIRDDLRKQSPGTPGWTG